ncbi:MAG TPA: D-glycerate dehydrogenase [Anaeromyxobacteraceae bacterium]|nr:D-glycerate dehydrogenase [Anaeromyxobacteraceae bacterium]
MKPILYVARSFPGLFPARLRELFEVRGNAPRPPPRETLVKEAAGAAVLALTYLDRVDDGLLGPLPTVRHVASYGVGLNHIDLDACRRRGVLVTNTPGVVTNATADLAMGLLLAAARRIAEGDRVIRAGGWKEVDPSWMLGTEVTGKTLGIVGFGRIGQAVARRAQGFEMKILYASPRPVEFAGADRVALEDLLARSDFVSLHVPLKPGTENLISRERLRLMKRGAILVNTARGQVLDDEAVAEALREGRLGAAGLDVFRDEPRVPEVYRALENVVLVPHLGSGTQETRQAMSRMVWEDIERVATGQPPRHPVT